MEQINSSNSATPMIVGTGIGVGAGLGVVSGRVQNAKAFLKDAGFDTFDKVKEFTEKYKTTRKNGILITSTKKIGKNELKEIMKKRMSACGKMTSEELTNMANRAFKTTKKTYAKYAAIFGAIGLTVGGAIALIKKSKQKTTETQKNNI